MENLVKETEVAIIGAGYGGLTAAALLARKGIRAEVFECLSVPGGRARSTERDGFTLDHGVHGYRCADDSAGARVLRELGETIKWVPEHGNRAMLVTGGKRFVYPQKVADIFRLPLLSPGDALRFTLILLKILTVPVSMIADTSFAQFAGRASKRPQVRTMLQALGLAAMAPDIDQASAGEVVHLLRRGIRARQGIGHPLGGEKQVIDKLK